MEETVSDRPGPRGPKEVWGIKRSARFGAAVAAALVVATLGAMPALAQDQKPWSAAFAGSAAFTSPTTAVYQGSGDVKHLGGSTVAGTVTAVGPAPCDGFAAQHTVTITASSGDQLFISVTATACTEGTNQYHGFGSYTITGGTGRFAGATGNGAMDGHCDFNAGTFTLTFNGTISY